MAIVGADVWKKGWVAVAISGDAAEVESFEHLRELLDRFGDASVVALDIPIGLPADPPRRADVEARSFVGSRRSSVFPAPPREVLEQPNYEAARNLSKNRYGQGLSAQSYALRRRTLEAAEIADVDRRVVEVHPEVSFRALARSHLLHSKRTWNGQAERRRLLQRAGIALPRLLAGAAGEVPVDDVLDAAIAAWSARRFQQREAESLPAGSAPAERGVIWY